MAHGAWQYAVEVVPVIKIKNKVRMEKGETKQDFSQSVFTLTAEAVGVLDHFSGLPDDAGIVTVNERKGF